jgi:hypothetical protein
MSIPNVTELLTDNIGVMYEHVLLLVVVLGGFIFYARYFKIGLMLHFACVGVLFTYFYQYNLYYVSSLAVFFMFFVIMVLSLYASGRVSRTGGIV